MLAVQLKDVITQALLRRDAGILNIFWQKMHTDIVKLKRVCQNYQLQTMMNEFICMPFYKKIRAELLKIKLEENTIKTDLTKDMLIKRLASELLNYLQYENEQGVDIDDAVDAYIDQLDMFYSESQGKMIVLEQSRLLIEVNEEIKQEIETVFRQQLQAEFEFITFLIKDEKNHITMLSKAISTAKIRYEGCLKRHTELESREKAAIKQLNDMTVRHNMIKTAAIDKWLGGLGDDAHLDNYYPLICEATLAHLAEDKMRELPSQVTNISISHMKLSIQNYLSATQLRLAIKKYLMSINISYQTVVTDHQRTIFHLAASLNVPWIFEICFRTRSLSHVESKFTLSDESQKEVLAMRDARGETLLDIALRLNGEGATYLLMSLYLEYSGNGFDEVRQVLARWPGYINKRVNPNKDTLLHRAIKKGKFDVAFELLDNRQQNGLDLSMRNNDNLTIFEVVVDQSSAHKYNGLTLCDMAIYHKDPVIFFENLQRDLAPSLFKTCLNALNAYGNTRLHTAMRLRNCELAYKLVSMGVDLNIKNSLDEFATILPLIKGLPLAHSAVYCGRIDVFVKLAEAGPINIHQQSEDGCSLWDTIFMSAEEQVEKNFRVDLTPFRSFITALVMNTLIEASGSDYRVNINFDKYGVTVPKDAYVIMNEKMSGFERALIKEIIELDELVQPHIEKSREAVDAVYLRELTQWERFVRFFSTKKCEEARARQRNQICLMLDDMRNSFVYAAREKQDQGLFDVVAHAIEHTKELADSYKVVFGAITAFVIARPETAYKMKNSQLQQERDAHAQAAEVSKQEAKKSKQVAADAINWATSVVLKGLGFAYANEATAHNLDLYEAVSYYTGTTIKCPKNMQEVPLLTELSHLIRQLGRPIVMVVLTGKDSDELACYNTEVMRHSSWGSEDTIFVYYDLKTKNFSGIKLISKKSLTKILKDLQEQHQADVGVSYAPGGPGLFSGAANSETNEPSASAHENTL